MPSTRRVKILALAVGLIVLSILYLTSNARKSDEEVYRRTVAGLRTNAQAKTDAAAADAEVARKLKEHADAAATHKQAADPATEGLQKQPPEVVVIDGDNTIRKTIKGGEKWDVSSGKEAATEVKEDEVTKTDEEKAIDVELNSILKRSPIIIFSKSYCRFSAKAKRILIDTYSIVPAPFVVELDLHPLGPQLQSALAKSTGRPTVPNVLISGKSIGGGDDIEKLHMDGELISKVKAMGGKRIMEAQLREVTA